MGLTENDNCKKLGFLYAVLQSAKPYKAATAAKLRSAARVAS